MAKEGNSKAEGGKKAKKAPPKPSFLDSIPRWAKIAVGLMAMSAWYVAKLPCPIVPLEYSLNDPPVLEYNDVLRQAEHVYRAAVNGPNSMVFIGGKIYVGNADGRLVELDLEYNSADSVLFTGNPNSALPLPCGEYNTEHLCGRPMGLGATKKGQLIITDSYLGLIKVNLKSHQKSTLSSRKAKDNKNPYALLHSVAVAPDTDVTYFTDSSYVHHNRDTAYSFLDARPFGRVFMYTPRSGSVTTLIKDLHFPTGIVLSKNEDFLLVAERTVARIIKYSLKGSKKGKTEVWADNLPIYPEEITYDIDGNIWVCGSQRDWREKLFLPSWLRILMAKTLSPAAISSVVDSQQSAALRMDITSGKILNAYTDSSGRTPAITSAFAIGNYVYLGSNMRKFNYIARITRDKLGLQSAEAIDSAADGAATALLNDEEDEENF